MNAAASAPNRGAGRVLGICADDIGLVAGAADTASDLAAAGRLTSASCVTTGTLWRHEAEALSGLETGLHFNLGEGAPLSTALAARWPVFPGLGKLIVLAHLGALPLAALADEWQAQVDAFTEATGHEPDFVDGHQHVHHLPGVRAVVLDGVARFGTPPAVRNTGHLVGPGAGFKRRVIEATGGRALEAELRQRGLRHNGALLGAYDFEAGYRERVVDWLAAAPAEGGLLFCHPCSAAALDGKDPIAAARRREAAYLDSDLFAADLAAAGVSVGPAWALRSSSAD
ncbi:MAG: ChbG/HpnK family deacetylase [Caldimonas sp.]